MCLDIVFRYAAVLIIAEFRGSLGSWPFGQRSPQVALWSNNRRYPTVMLSSPTNGLADQLRCSLLCGLFHQAIIAQCSYCGGYLQAKLGKTNSMTGGRSALRSVLYVRNTTSN